MNLVRRRLGVFPKQESDEPAVGCSHRRALRVVFGHEPGDLFYPDEGTKGAGARAHRLLDTAARVGLELFGAKQAEHDPLLVHDHASAPSRRSRALGHLPHPIVKAAGRDVAASYIAGPGVRGVGTFGWEPGGHPVEFAIHVVVHAVESEALEPPRGPWAQVSGRVPAVDDDRPAGIQHGSGLGLQLPKRKTYGPGEMILFVLGRRQDLDNLGIFIYEPLNLLAIDSLGHDYLL